MQVHDRLLLYNVLGHAGGALIFAIFLALLFSGRGWSGRYGRNLTGLAAALSLVWNLGSLVILAFPGLPPRVLDVTAAISFSVLSLLPAVLLHLSLDESRKRLVACGYALSSVAIAMHAWEIHQSGASLHQVALLIITIGFLALTTIAVAGAAFRRRRVAILRRNAHRWPRCAWPCSPCRFCISGPGTPTRRGPANW